MSNNSPLNVSGPAAMLAAIPALLGYVPINRLIAIILHRIGDRHDIKEGITIGFNTNAAAVRTVAQGSGITAINSSRVVLVLVNNEVEDRDHAIALLEAATDSFTDADVPVAMRLIVDDLADGTWTDFDNVTRTGSVDYRASAITAHAVLAGRAVAPSREALSAEFAPSNTIDHHVTAAGGGDILTLRADFAAAIANRDINTDIIERIAHAITSSKTSRDILLGVALDDPSGAAIAWTTIANRLRGEARIEALTVAAARWYIAADGPRALFALKAVTADVSESGSESPGLAVLLQQAMALCIAPESLRDLIESNVDKLLREI